MNEFVIFFLILLISVFLSALFSKLHLPWVISLIVGGLLLGPSGLDIVVVDDTLRFFSEIGLVFLMFMVGLETKLSGFKKAGAGPYIMTIVNGLLPAIAGVFIGRVFGYNWTESLLLGIIFISTSIAVVVPVLESKKILKTRLGRTIIGGTMLKDISSLLLLSIFYCFPFIFFACPKKTKQKKGHFAEEFFAFSKNRLKTSRRFAPESRSFLRIFCTEDLQGYALTFVNLSRFFFHF